LPSGTKGLGARITTFSESFPPVTPQRNRDLVTDLRTVLYDRPVKTNPILKLYRVVLEEVDVVDGKKDVARSNDTMGRATPGNCSDQYAGRVIRDFKVLPKCLVSSGLGDDAQLWKSVEASIAYVCKEMSYHRRGNEVSDALGVLESLHRDADDLSIGDDRPTAVAGVDGRIDLDHQQGGP
jgi:hypothetical protein